MILTKKYLIFNLTKSVEEMFSYIDKQTDTQVRACFLYGERRPIRGWVADIDK